MVFGFFEVRNPKKQVQTVVLNSKNSSKKFLEFVLEWHPRLCSSFLMDVKQCIFSDTPKLSLYIFSGVGYENRTVFARQKLLHCNQR